MSYEVVPICVPCWRAQHPKQTAPDMSLQPSRIPDKVVGKPCYLCKTRENARVYGYRDVKSG